eukprot:c7854_g1_i1.p1 GENE.c7854_g1_i1~~c7854_g1_i1.p1  ORF type:complete len:430 (+),score=78.31 c7854_g1_i1:30-1292(+)
MCRLLEAAQAIYRTHQRPQPQHRLQSERLVEAGVVRNALEAMDRFPSRPDVQQEACELFTLARGAEGGVKAMQSILENSDGIRRILRALLNHPNIPTIYGMVGDWAEVIQSHFADARVLVLGDEEAVLKEVRARRGQPEKFRVEISSSGSSAWVRAIAIVDDPIVQRFPVTATSPTDSTEATGNSPTPTRAESLPPHSPPTHFEPPAEMLSVRNLDDEVAVGVSPDMVPGSLRQSGPGKRSQPWASTRPNKRAKSDSKAKQQREPSSPNQPQKRGMAFNALASALSSSQPMIELGMGSFRPILSRPTPPPPQSHQSHPPLSLSPHETSPALLEPLAPVTPETSPNHQPPNDAPVKQYSVTDVRNFFKSLFPIFDESVVMTNGVDGEMLLELTDDDLKQFLMMNDLQIRKLRRELGRLRDN